MIRKQINVTQDCIDYGNFYGNQCPVALACKQAGISEPIVNHSRLSCYMPDEHNRLRVHYGNLPFKISQAIKQFDRGNSMSPVSFHITLYY